LFGILILADDDERQTLRVFRNFRDLLASDAFFLIIARAENDEASLAWIGRLQPFLRAREGEHIISRGALEACREAFTDKRSSFYQDDAQAAWPINVSRKRNDGGRFSIANTIHGQGAPLYVSRIDRESTLSSER
jgi:hypothetical protein